MAESPPPPRVQNIVINALLESFYDVLDMDGKVSILRAAGALDLLGESLNPREYSDYALLEKIVDAMNQLLQFSEEIAYVIGRKFAVYSDPTGSGIHTLVRNLKDWIQADWDLQVIQEDLEPPRIILQVTNCPFCGRCKQPGVCGTVTCDFLRGIFSMAWEKTSREAVVCMETDHVFTLVMMDQGGEA
jgi:predicted hydrocarbon binding protein